MKKAILPVIALLALAGIVGGWYWRTDNTSAELTRVAAGIDKTLPEPYVDELVMEHAHVDGNRLVVDIRIPYARFQQMNSDKIPLIRNQEQNDLDRAACANYEFAELLQRKAQVVRRFIDRDGKLVFELTAHATDCNPP